MNSDKQTDVVEATERTEPEHPFGTDGAGRTIYYIFEGPIPKPGAFVASLDVLEALAQTYNAPHYAIRNFEKIDMMGGVVNSTAKGLTLHFTYIQGEMVVAYQKCHDTKTIWGHIISTFRVPINGGN